ncbi:MAG: hypothetical protein ACKVHF_01970, partial [Candidatus Poseidoniales archaeon]
PLDLPSPRLELSELQLTLEKRASEHKIRDIKRRNESKIEPYHNGALFGLDPTIPPDEIDDSWKVSVLPSEDYLQNPRLAGRAWLHAERRHRSD